MTLPPESRTTMRFMAQFRMLTNLSTLRIARNVLLAAFYLVSDYQVSSAGEPRSRMLATQAMVPPSHAETTANRVRLAEGEYKVLTENGIGPFLPAVYGFSESWTLSRLADGTLEVNGTRSYRSPSYESHSIQFVTHLSSDLRVLQLTEFRKLKWRHDSGPITCDFTAGPDLVYVECEGCSTKRKSEFVHEGAFRLHVADFRIFFRFCDSLRRS
jgi:hypothetical protein